MGTETSAAAPAEGTAATPSPDAGAAAAAGAGAQTPGDTTQDKPGEKGAASASTGTDAQQKAPPDAAAADGAEAKPTEGEGEAGKDAGEKPADAPLELKLPEGFVKDEAVLGEFQSLAKELGLKADKAQALVDLHVKMQESFVREVQAEQTRLSTEWKRQVLEDTATYGAQPYEEIVSVSKRALQKFGSPELLEVLEQSGLGNHPAVIRFTHTVGKALREDSVAGTSRTGPGSKPISDEMERLYQRYPTMRPKES